MWISRRLGIGKPGKLRTLFQKHASEGASMYKAVEVFIAHYAHVGRAHDTFYIRPHILEEAGIFLKRGAVLAIEKEDGAYRAYIRRKQRSVLVDVYPDL